MAIILKNNATGTLAVALTTTGKTVTLKPGDGGLFPELKKGEWFPLTAIRPDGQLEVMKATARKGDNITVTRGQEDTLPLAFAAGDRVELRLTAGVMNELLKLTPEDIGAYPVTGGVVSGFIDSSGIITSLADFIQLRNDKRAHFAIRDADYRVRMNIYKDKGGDGIHINNGYDGGGDLVFEKTGKLKIPQHVEANGEIRSLSIDGLRHIYKNQAAFWRNNNENFHLLFTEKDDPYGGHSKLRPLTVLLETGDVTFGHNVAVKGEVSANTLSANSITAGDATVHADGNISGPVWGDYLNNYIHKIANSTVQAIRLVYGGEVSPSRIGISNPYTYDAAVPNGAVGGGIRYTKKHGNGYFQDINIYAKYKWLQVMINGEWHTVGE